MDSKCLVVVADGTYARFFILDVGSSTFLEAGPQLIELDDLVNIEHKLGGYDKFSSTRSGLSRNPRGGPSHGYDDHRVQHEQEHERRFAEDVTVRAITLAQKYRVRDLVMVSEIRMLGFLRKTLGIPIKAGINVRELAKDLTKMTPSQMLDHLTTMGLIPLQHELSLS